MNISYAQNFEDVLLGRCLKDIEKGFYIDVGAQHPVVDSVSLAFYEKGWRGVHVEPTPQHAALLREHRPDETVLQVVVAEKAGPRTLWEFPDTGLSTLDPAIAERHRSTGFRSNEITVPALPLATILDSLGDQDVHWLKIDVEGSEGEVLRSWAPSQVRPWIVVVESTLPLTTQQSHEQWEQLLLGLGYTFAFFDGLNRYYVSQEHVDLRERLSIPVNVFDQFHLSGTSSWPLCWHVEDRLKRQLLDHEQAHRIAVETMLAEKQELDRRFSEQSSRVVWQDEELSNLRGTVEKLDVGLAACQERAVQLARRCAQLSASLETSQRTGSDRLARREAELALLRSELDQSNAAVERLSKECGHATGALSICEERLALVQAERVSAIARQAQLKGDLDASRTLLSEQESLVSSLSSQVLGIRAHLEAARSELAQREVLTKVSLGLLLEHRGERFLESAYAQILRRPPDPVGRAHYLGQLARGRGRINVLAQLHASPEGRKVGVAVPGLRSAARWDRLSRLPGFRWVLEPVALSLYPYGLTFDLDTHDASTPESGQLSWLLCQEGRAFLQTAYQTLLLRHPDPEGLLHYTRLLNDGVPKWKILVQISGSHEARNLKTKVPGLARLRFLSALQKLPPLSLLLSARLPTASVHAGSTSNAPDRLAPLDQSHPAATIHPQDSDGALIHRSEQYRPMLNSSKKYIPNTLTWIVAADDLEFINRAYATVLRRNPDSVGLEYYAERLRSGDSKIQVLRDLRRSAEGRAVSARIDGLRTELLKLVLSRVPFLGTVLGGILSVEGNSPFERRLRRIENSLSTLKAMDRQLSAQAPKPATPRDGQCSASQIYNPPIQQVASQKSATHERADPAPRHGPLNILSDSPREVLAEIKAYVRNSASFGQTPINHN